MFLLHIEHEFIYEKERKGGRREQQMNRRQSEQAATIGHEVSASSHIVLVSSHTTDRIADAHRSCPIFLSENVDRALIFMCIHITYSFSLVSTPFRSYPFLFKLHLSGDSLNKTRVCELLHYNYSLLNVLTIISNCHLNTSIFFINIPI
jgi:hypothetical protein